jgi:nicotinic acid mononucleotide adenylyltransferase
MKKYSQFLRELPSNTVVFAFGRFNPPTSGHELLIKAVKKLAATNKAAHAIYASKSQDAKKNPLTVEKKVHYLKLMFPSTNFVAANPAERTFIEAAKALNKKYKNLIMVAGSDRIAEYERILNTYNGKEFNFDTVQVVSAGERDPDADDATGMSASKMRAVASKGDYSQFKKGLPSTMREIDGRRLMNDVRQGMGLEAVKEQLNLVKDDLREQYFRGEIFNIGDIVESAGISYEIVKRGSNHLLLKEESGKLVSKWIQDISLKQEELNLEETMIPEELTTKTLKSQDKIKVARIIATMLGIENAESSANADQLVNNALRKVRSKSLNAESLNILTKMLALAQEVGIKYDVTLVPSKLKESEEVDTKSTYNIAKDKLRYKDYVKLKAMNDGEVHTKPGHAFQHDDDTERKMKVKYHTEAVEAEQLDEISAKLAGNYYGAATKKHIEKVGVKPNMYDRIEKDMGKKRKQGVDRAMDRVMGTRKTNEEMELDESQTADWQKIQSMDKGSVLAGKDGAKKRLAYLSAVHDHHKKYGNDTKKVKSDIEKINRSRLAEASVCPNCAMSVDDCECESKDIVKGDAHQLGAHNAKGFDAFFESADSGDLAHNTVDLSDYEKDYSDNIGDEEISDEELDAMANEITDMEHIIDVYEDDELAIVDDDTGEELEESDEERSMNEQALMEVLSRMERMKAKVRMRRTKAKRERATKIALKRYSGTATINKRSRRLAVKLMKKRLLRGRDPAKISVGEKERVERVIERRKKIIGRLAMRLAPRVRKIEKARMSHTKFTAPAPAVGM